MPFDEIAAHVVCEGNGTAESGKSEPQEVERDRCERRRWSGIPIAHVLQFAYDSSGPY